ncbi:hypothetical protein HMPREF9720_2507 [Alistipes sp. HGB5]|nr:hypothetical protein HMPREF9720_2507 [Alistipes sp. HGB5]
MLSARCEAQPSGGRESNAAARKSERRRKYNVMIERYLSV